MKYLLILPLLWLSGCVTPEVNNTGVPLMTEEEIQSTVEQNTAHQQVYDGLYTVMDMTVTLRNSKVIEAQLHQEARDAQWDRTKFMNESEKARVAAKNATEIFLSFFTPDHKNDDLHKSAKTTWHIYLEAEGKRWEGNVTKLKTNFAALRSLYPEHNAFGTPYIISFPVATESLDGKASKFIVTGPLGAGSVEFAAGGASPR